jgi:hypothetical protein
MRAYARRMAVCAMMVALGVVLMFLLGLTGIGTYAAPLFACLLLVPLQREYGTGTALTVWLATGLLTLLLATDREMALVYLTIFGWYPLARPQFQRLPRLLRPVLKLAAFNGATVVTYALLLPFLGLELEMMEPWLLAALLAMGNLTFFLEDRFLIPKLVPMWEQRLSHWLKK